MPKGLVVTGMGNRIVWATHNGKGLITGDRKDVTDEAIKAVFQHLKEEHERNKKGSQSFGYRFEGLGEIHFHPHKELDADRSIRRKDDENCTLQ